MGKDTTEQRPKVTAGHIKKGGINQPPTTPKPQIKPPPQNQAQGAKKS